MAFKSYIECFKSDCLYIKPSSWQTVPVIWDICIVIPFQCIAYPDYKTYSFGVEIFWGKHDQNLFKVSTTYFQSMNKPIDNLGEIMLKKRNAVNIKYSRSNNEPQVICGICNGELSELAVFTSEKNVYTVVN